MQFKGKICVLQHIDVVDFIKPKKRAQLPISFGTLIVLFVIGLYLSYNAGLSRSGKAPQDEKSIAQLKKHNNQLQQALVALERDYEIQTQAQKSLAHYLKMLQQHNSELTHDVALYQTMTGTAAASQKLHIMTFQVFSTDSTAKFRYLLVLGKQTSAQRYAQGTVMMTIVGKIGQNTVYLPVKYIDSAKNEGLAFKFRHFQELTGEITFPEGFVPESVLLQVEQHKYGSPFQKQFSWVVDNLLE